MILLLVFLVACGTNSNPPSCSGSSCQCPAKTSCDLADSGIPPSVRARAIGSQSERAVGQRACCCPARSTPALVIGLIVPALRRRREAPARSPLLLAPRDDWNSTAARSTVEGSRSKAHYSHRHRAIKVSTCCSRPCDRAEPGASSPRDPCRLVRWSSPEDTRMARTTSSSCDPTAGRRGLAVRRAARDAATARSAATPSSSSSWSRSASRSWSRSRSRSSSRWKRHKPRHSIRADDGKLTQAHVRRRRESSRVARTLVQRRVGAIATPPRTGLPCSEPSPRLARNLARARPNARRSAHDARR